MNSRICICCGEAMVPDNSHSRNPHICASCSSILDGIDEKTVLPEPTTARPTTPGKEALTQAEKNVVKQSSS